MVGPFIPRPPALVLCSGESSAGKTILGYNIAAGLAAGSDIFNFGQIEPTNVIYVDLETPRGLRGHFLDKIGRHTNLGYILELEDKLNTYNGYEDFLAVCREFTPSVVIIDPLSTE